MKNSGSGVRHIDSDTQKLLTQIEVRIISLAHNKEQASHACNLNDEELHSKPCFWRLRGKLLAVNSEDE